jgi:hypothetical protein
MLSSTSQSESFDVFVSYRKSTGRHLAALVYDSLSASNYRVYLDTRDLEGGPFDQALLQAIETTADFLIVLTAGCLDRCKNEEDWVRQEIRHALSTHRHIVGLMDEDFNFPENLPHEIAELTRHQAVRYSSDYSGESLRKLASFLTPASTRIRTLQAVIHKEIRRTRSFVGRESDIAALDRMLLSDTGKQGGVNHVRAITGLPGVGKTTLARELAWRNRESYAGIWWLQADSAINIVLGLTDLGSHLNKGLDARKDVPFGTLAETAKRVLGFLTGAGFDKPWLLVYDDVESPNKVADWLPSSGAQVLITTRWSSDWHDMATALAIDVFPRDVAVSFLETRADRKGTSGADGLATELGCLPFALDIAGAYCKQTGLSFAEYRTKLAELIAKVPRYASYPGSIFATLDLAIGRAIESAAAAEALMGVLAFLAPERIAIELVHDGFMSLIERGDAIAALRELSIINYETTGESLRYISVHRLVQQVTRVRLQDSGAADAAAAATLLVARAFPLDDDNKSWRKCLALLPHALAVLEHAPESLEGLNDQGWLAHRKTQLSQRVARYRQHLDDDELSTAFLHFTDDVQAAQVVAENFSRLKPEMRERVMRLAWEQTLNEHLQPIRDALHAQPATFQSEIRARVDRASDLRQKLRELVSQRDDEAICMLVADHLDEFPIGMQEKLKLAYGDSQRNESDVAALSAAQKARAKLRHELAPPVVTLETKDRWRGFKEWARRIAGTAQRGEEE